MSTNIKFTDQMIQIMPGRFPFWILMLVGLTSIVIGIYLFNRSHPNTHWLFGIGLIFAAAGLLFQINMSSSEIFINRPEGFITIVDNKAEMKRPIRIPVGYYNRISVQIKLGESGSDGSRISYEILLVSNQGSSIFVTALSSESDALDFGRRLQGLTGLDLYFNNSPIGEERQTRDSAGEGIAVELPGDTSILRMLEGGDTVISWKNRYGIVDYLLLLAIIYGFFHIIRFAVFPANTLGIGMIMSYSILSLIFIFLLSIAVMNTLGRYELHLNYDGIQYFSNIFGRRVGYREMKLDDINSLRNSINMSDNSMLITSHKGKELMDRLMNKFGPGGRPSLDMSIISSLLALRSEILTIDVSSLSITERLFIEQEIVDCLKKYRIE